MSSRCEPKVPKTKSRPMAICDPTRDPPATIVTTAIGTCASILSIIVGNSGHDAVEMDSVKTSRIPPHVSPTANASSSLTPYTSTEGATPLRASCPRSKAAPSTHPPLIDPTTSSLEVTKREAPGRRGAERQVRTTVASATALPAAISLLSSRSTSFIRNRSLEPAGVDVGD
ncbi:unannotated protein [freshwater metagenome]|uniref:Unannotated protein n=1 Tax=freshwater metagenome TaxID=449393 RepID=A0A6J6PSH0_9ZZZZ